MCFVKKLEHVESQTKKDARGRYNRSERQNRGSPSAGKQDDLTADDAKDVTAGPRGCEFLALIKRED